MSSKANAGQLQRLARFGDRHGRYPAAHWGCTASALSPEAASLCRGCLKRH
jgi:hypothetical protein